MKETKFKQTEIGLVPEDWEIDKFENIFKFISNNTFSRDMLAEDGIVKNIHYGDVLIKFGSVVDVQKSKLPFIADSSYKARNYVKDGDVVIADTAEDETVGKCCEVINAGNDKIVSGLHTMWLRKKNEDNFFPRFVGYFMNGSLYHNQLLPLIQGIKVSSISKSAIKETYLLIPPLSEQSRIASALTSIDNLISSLDKLIAKKKLIKQGAMQELLTGKRRLKGYGEPWVEKRIGDIGFTYNGLTGKSKNDFGCGNAKYVTFLNVLNNPILQTAMFENVRVSDDERQNKVITGDLLFNTSSETPEEVGICSLLNDDVENLYLNSFCFGYRITDVEVDGLFLSYYFRSRYGRDLMAKLAQGSTRYNLSKDNFMKSSITIPSSLSEQSSIASILTSMDGEISMLEVRRVKYEAVKRGMMQELLTGRVRVK